MSRARARSRRLAVATAAAMVATMTTAADLRAHGRSLFEGEVPLAAQISGQGLALPAQASRCANCHSAEATASDVRGRSASDASRPIAAKLGARLDADSLRRSQPRRGGPPSQYDAASMCRLLRTGIDPVSVIVDRNMPRYEISTADCDALWAYLTGPRL